MIRLLIADDEVLEREALADIVAAALSTRSPLRQLKMAARRQIRRCCGAQT